jgi:hypothetical protein
VTLKQSGKRTEHSFIVEEFGMFWVDWKGNMGSDFLGMNPLAISGFHE